MWINTASARSRTWPNHTLSAPRNSARGDTLHLLRTDHLACGGQCGPRARAQFATCMDKSHHHRGTALLTLRCEPARTRLGAGPVAVVRETYAGKRYDGCSADVSPVFHHCFPGYEVEPCCGLQHLLQHGAMSAWRFERAETPKPISRCRSAVCERGTLKPRSRRCTVPSAHRSSVGR